MGGKILKESEGAGLVFERLTVVGWAGKTNRNHRLWKCLCSCGNFVELELDALKRGNTKSCGCLNLESLLLRSTKHGATKSNADKELASTFSVWAGIRKRCYNPKDHAYADYGGRGITVTQEWETFEVFFKDMGLIPPNHSLERINNNEGYSKNNCKWIPKSDQNSNKRTTIRVQYEGKEWCLKKLCEYLSIPYMRTYKRFKLRGWSLIDSIRNT